MVREETLLGIGATVIIGVVVFVLADIMLDLFGVEIKDKIKGMLPEGFKTSSGEVVK